MSRYTYIIDKLREVTGPDRTIDCYVWVITQTADARMHYYASQDDSFVWERGIDGMWIRGVKDKATVPAYTASIDACVALVERMLPNQHMIISKNLHHNYLVCTFTYLNASGDPRQSAQDHSYSLPAAILLTLFQALEAKEMTA